MTNLFNFNYFEVVSMIGYIGICLSVIAVIVGLLFSGVSRKVNLIKAFYTAIIPIIISYIILGLTTSGYIFEWIGLLYKLLRYPYGMGTDIITTLIINVVIVFVFTWVIIFSICKSISCSKRQMGSGAIRF